MRAVDRILRDPPDSLRQLILAIHQDFDVQAEQSGGLLPAIGAMVEGVEGRQKSELTSTLTLLLREARRDQLRAMLARHGASFVFDSKTAVQIFQTWLDSLERHR